MAPPPSVTYGFDVVPALTNSDEDKLKWSRFLARIKQHFVFWEDTTALPKTDHIAFAVGGKTLKLPKDGTKFRSFAKTCSWDSYWGDGEVISTVQKYASYELGQAMRMFSSLIAPNDFMYEEGDERLAYSAEEVAACLSGVDSSVDVDWAEYGGEPNQLMWNSLAIGACNSWFCCRLEDEMRKRFIQENEFFGRRMEAFGKSWSVIKVLRMCHRFGDGDTAKICKLPVELVTAIEDHLMVSNGATASLSDMLEK